MAKTMRKKQTTDIDRDLLAFDVSDPPQNHAQPPDWEKMLSLGRKALSKEENALYQKLLEV